jgi:hypothetical protein
MDRRESLKTLFLGALSVPFFGEWGHRSGVDAARLQAAGQQEWQDAYDIAGLTPKQKIGGLLRANDPSFFEAAEGRLVTRHGRFKRHRTAMLPQWEMTAYPYRLRVTLRKQDHRPVSAGLIFGAKTPYEFELGGADTHGALLAYVSESALAFRDHRTDGTQVWKGRRTALSDAWTQGDTVTLTLALAEGAEHGTVTVRVTGDRSAELSATPIDLGKPDAITGEPHVRGHGYFGVAVDGPGEVEVLGIKVGPGPNAPRTSGLAAYERPCEWCVLKANRQQEIALTFALREARETALSLRHDGTWGTPEPIPGTGQERAGGMTVYTHSGTWSGPRPDRYRLVQDGTPVYEGRVPPFNANWTDEREVVGVGLSCDEIWRYKQQNQLNWFDNILTEEEWQGQEHAFGRYSDNIGDTGAEFIKYQGTGHDWPDFIFAGDDYPGYPDNPILTLGEVDYQQRIWDVFAANDALRELHGNVPSAFKGGDHEFANSSSLQPGGEQGQKYPNHIRTTYKAISLDGHEPVSENEASYISRPIPGWIEVFHVVTRYNQDVNINTRDFPDCIDDTAEQTPSGTEVMRALETWARTSPAPFTIVHGDHPLADIRTVSAKETYRLYPWERRRLVRLIVETGLLYAIGDEHNLRLVRYTDFSGVEPADPVLKPLDDVSIYEFGLSNLSGEWFRRLRETSVSGEGARYEVLHQTPEETQAIAHGFQKWNGYTVFRFDKQARAVTFEIWTRHGEDEDYRAKDPRREAQDFSTEIRPVSVMWASSMLPPIDLTEHGLSPARARYAVYRVHDGGSEPLFSNRADADGRIEGMPCPSVEHGASVEVDVEEGPTIPVETT